MRRTFVLPLALLAGCFYDPPSIADSTADESTGDGGDMNPTTMPPPATTSPADTGPPPDGEGRIVYRQNGRLFLLTLGEGTRDISSELVSLGWAEAGMDPYINISSDGEWLVLDTERAHESCDGWACLAVVRTDLSEGEPLLNNFEAMHPEAGADVAEGGGLVVFSGIGTVNTTDLFVSVREGDFWSAPLLITAESTFEENRHPALSPDGSSVLFDCGDWGDRSICEVGVDGSGFGVVVSRDENPGGAAGDLHHGSYAPDGGLVFEASWPGESIWYRPDGGEPVPLGGYENDNSPCVLPDGSVVSLWLAGPNNTTGLHELKLMSASGSEFEMLVTGVDIMDIGLGCGA